MRSALPRLAPVLSNDVLSTTTRSRSTRKAASPTASVRSSCRGPRLPDGELDILTKSGIIGLFASPGGLPRRIDQKMVSRTQFTSVAGRCTIYTGPTNTRWTPGSRIVPRDAWALRAGAHGRRLDPSKGINGEGFKFMLQYLDTGRCWVKLSPRISKQDNFRFSDTTPRSFVNFWSTLRIPLPLGL